MRRPRLCMLPLIKAPGGVKRYSYSYLIREKRNNVQADLQLAGHESEKYYMG